VRYWVTTAIAGDVGESSDEGEQIGMSYILEALKKIEQESDNAGEPKVLSYRAGATPRPRRRPLWPYLLITALLLNAGMFFWWAHSRRSDDQQMVVQAPVISQAPAVHLEVAALPTKPPASPTPESRPSDMKSGMKEVPGKRDAGEPPARVARKRDREAPLSANGKADTGVAASAQPQPRAESMAKPGGKVLSLDELPPALKSRLPGFRVSGHAYSPDAGSRVARINDQIVQEGGSLAPGVRVEEITPEGIVLGYQGYRFQIGFNPN
jgi:general secretion pathway protein B